MVTLFQISNLLALPFWVLMIVLPYWRWTKRIIASPLIAAPLAVMYAVLVIPWVGVLVPALTQPTLAGIAALLGTPDAALIAWVHFLAFDLFTGRWIYLDSRERGINAWLMAPVLAFTFLLGPLGFAVYLLVRTAQGAFVGRRAGGAAIMKGLVA